MNPIKIARDFIKMSYDYSSVQFDFPPEESKSIMNWGLKNIPNKILAEDGREIGIHVTCLYGLHISDFTKVRDLFVSEPPIKVIMGNITLFENEDADVVKIDLESPDLHRLNKLLRDNFEVTNTHKEYIPHCTIAYVKSGLGKVYDGMGIFKGRKVSLNTVSFSGRDNRKTSFKLRYPKPASL